MFDLDPVFLMLKFDPDMVKIYLHTKNEVSISIHSKVKIRTEIHTDTTKTLPTRILGK